MAFKHLLHLLSVYSHEDSDFCSEDLNSDDVAAILERRKGNNVNNSEIK